MKIHYFQRYHEKENVATANTMLLLSRLYSYSSDKFFRLLKSEFFSDSFEPEITFTLQEKSVSSVPDATIMQESFKIVIETKMFDWFQNDQLVKHLHAFGDEKYKVLVTLAPEFMEKEKMTEFENHLKEYNAGQRYPIIHINTTFEILANAFRDVIDDIDYEMHYILDDYLNYCQADGLITTSDAWKYMRVNPVGRTFEFCIKNNLYYCYADKSFKPHAYIGLYTNKSVRAIGKIHAIITANKTEDGIDYTVEQGELTDELKLKIESAIVNKAENGWFESCRYFFVEEFFSTDFKKITPRGLWGVKIFDLTQIFEVDKMPETKVLAEGLKKKTWG